MPDRPEPEPTQPTKDAKHPASREPYYEGYFGTEEEEGVEREREAPPEDEEPTSGAPRR